MTLFQYASLQLLTLFAVARLAEMISSRLRAKEARELRGVGPAREAWWPLIVLTHVMVLGGAAATVIFRGNVPPLPILVVAYAALALATGVRLWMFLALRGRWNVRVMDPGTIVTSGPYRHIRHPNYLAVILEVAALPLAMGAYEVAILGSIANALVLSMRIPFEERQLSAAHATYRDTMMSRPRFIPR